jgi:hypothetical protein
MGRICSTFMERQYSCFCRGIVDNTWRRDETGHTGETDNMAFVLLDHGRHEFLHHPEMADDVDCEDFDHPFVGCVE